MVVTRMYVCDSVGLRGHDQGDHEAVPESLPPVARPEAIASNETVPRYAT
jgi:hypothetical protein